MQQNETIAAPEHSNMIANQLPETQLLFHHARNANRSFDANISSALLVIVLVILLLLESRARRITSVSMFKSRQ
jgi:hypothetical protein